MRSHLANLLVVCCGKNGHLVRYVPLVKLLLTELDFELFVIGLCYADRVNMHCYFLL